MRVDDAIRLRRTVKEYVDEPVPDAVVGDLLDLAVLAPNHRLTEPWRFWVCGPHMLSLLVAESGDRKLRRSATAVVVGIVASEDAEQVQEDYAACACALQNAMLAARARGLASFWRTPSVLQQPAVRAVLGAPANVRLVGMLHLGRPAAAFPPTPPRRAEPFTTWLT
jgi:nitroreductase